MFRKDVVRLVFPVHVLLFGVARRQDGKSSGEAPWDVWLYKGRVDGPFASTWRNSTGLHVP
jgi:hypothetical protein